MSINDRGDGEDELEEFSSVNDSKFLPDVPETFTTSSFLENIGKKKDRNYGIEFDPTFAKFGLLLNKDSLLKIKDLKSNLGAKPKVIFNNFLKKLKIGDNIDDISSNKQKGNNYKNDKFNICSELIRNKLKELPKDKADKARKFAYSLLSKKLAKGYAASLSKGELAKQLIHHAATWKPTKLGSISREQEIDTALSVAWKSIIAGTWQPPLEWAKAEVLNYEYLLYLKKYQELGIISYEVRTLEIEVDKLLGGRCDLEGKIKSRAISEFDYVKKSDEELYKPQDQLFYSSKDIVCKDMISKSDYCNNAFETELAEDAAGESNIIYSVDLSNLSDNQKHIALQGTDTEIMEITTANNRQYFGRLKTMEVNDSGELVMKLVPEIGKEFIESENRMLLTSDITGVGTDFGKNRLTYDSDDVTGSCKNDIWQVQEKSRRFTGIDKALARILNNLSCNYDDK